MVPSGPTATNDTVESHVVVSSVVPVAEYSSLSSLQEKTVRLKRDMRIYVKNFIHLFPSPVMRGNKFEKSHIHILESETLSRESRVTESIKECQFNSLRLHRVHIFFTSCQHFYTLCGMERRRGEDDEYMSHLVSYWWTRRTQYITSICLFYKKWDFYLECYLTVKN